MMASLATMARVKYQLKRVSQGKATRPAISPLWALVSQQVMTGQQTKKYRDWMAQRGA
jgi:hypothetical protein